MSARFETVLGSIWDILVLAPRQRELLRKLTRTSEECLDSERDQQRDTPQWEIPVLESGNSRKPNKHNY